MKSKSKNIGYMQIFPKKDYHDSLDNQPNIKLIFVSEHVSLSLSLLVEPGHYIILENTCVKYTSNNLENICVKRFHICEIISHIEYPNHAHVTGIYYVGYNQ